MTGFVVDLTNARERALICTDTLSYAVSGEHVPLGFASKAIPIPHLRGALIGSGIYDIQVRAAAELMLRPEVSSFDDVLAVLPDILQTETEILADQRGIDKPADLMLFVAGWVGWNAAERKFEMVTFANHESNYKPKRGYSGLIGIPNVPPEYVPDGFVSIASPEVRAMAALRAIRRFLDDHGEAIGMPPIGGEIVLSDVRPDGVSTRVVGRFDDFAETQDDARAVWTELASGERAHDGLDLVAKTADQAATLAKLQQSLAGGAVPGANRAERRRAEREARKAAKRVA